MAASDEVSEEKRTSGWRGLPSRKPIVIIALLVFAVLLVLAAVRPFTDRSDGGESETGYVTGSEVRASDAVGVKAD